MSRESLRYFRHIDNLRQSESFTVAIPISATIDDVYENLARDIERNGRSVSIRVYFFDGAWEPLLGFRDVLELQVERGVEGLVMVEHGPG
jgi:hypothetical protein